MSNPARRTLSFIELRKVIIGLGFRLSSVISIFLEALKLANLKMLEEEDFVLKAMLLQLNLAASNTHLMERRWKHRQAINRSRLISAHSLAVCLDLYINSAGDGTEEKVEEYDKCMTDD